MKRINIYVPREKFASARKKVSGLIKQTEKAYPNIHVCLIEHESVEVGTVGFDMNPVFQLTLRALIEEYLLRPNTWLKIKRFFGVYDKTLENMRPYRGESFPQ